MQIIAEFCNRREICDIFLFVSEFIFNIKIFYSFFSMTFFQIAKIDEIFQNCVTRNCIRLRNIFVNCANVANYFFYIVPKFRVISFFISFCINTLKIKAAKVKKKASNSELSWFLRYNLLPSRRSRVHSGWEYLFNITLSTSFENYPARKWLTYFNTYYNK